MISSRKTMWTGSRRSGQSAKKTGSIDRPAMGTCTARMKAIAFLMLSKMRRPRRTAATMDEKSSSSSTSDADSRATSVPRPPMAMPMWAAFSAGASLTPSPVMATTSRFAFERVDDAQLLLGNHAGKDLHVPDPPGQLLVRHPVELGPGDHRLAVREPGLAGDALGGRGIVARDHHHADAGGLALGDRGGHGRPQRVLEARAARRTRATGRDARRGGSPGA